MCAIRHYPGHGYTQVTCDPYPRTRTETEDEAQERRRGLDPDKHAAEERHEAWLRGER